MTSTRWCTPPPPTPGPTTRSPTCSRAWNRAPTSSRPSFYPLLHPASAPAPVTEAVERACAIGDSSVFVSGIDPGWALDILPILVSGVSAGIEEIRIQEIFNYALYDAPDVVREVIGFGGPMDQTPADAARRRARDGVGADGAHPRRRARPRARRRSAPRRATPARAHHRGRRAWARSRKARRARSASRCRASSTAVRCS